MEHSIDMEKVIEGLEVCINRVPGKYDCNKCPYEIDGNYCEINLAADALALLKEEVGEMRINDEPNKVTTVLKVVVTGEFYDDDATEETLRYAVEQDLEDAGFDVDVSLLKEQEEKQVIKQTYHVMMNRDYENPVDVKRYDWICPTCKSLLCRDIDVIDDNYHFCKVCGQAVKWNDSD